uniref:Uncharacterized protein n=1 Tax=Panagrolaimus sp. ES5 TaxID=591445 RepID=A0AC34F5J4_9BILA
MMATACPETTIISSRHHRPRAVVSSVVCTGTARIVYNAASGMLKGSVVDSCDNNFAVNGVLQQPFNVDEPSTSLADFFITDGDDGSQFSVLNIPVEWLPIVNVVTKATHYHLRISHPTIRFETKELLIGNRADLEIAQHLGAIVEREAGERPSVHLGPMQIKIVASQRTEPGFRRESICENHSVPIVEQSEDFLV